MVYQELLDRVQKNIEHGRTINRDDIGRLYQVADDATLARFATAVRKRHHCIDEATYLIMAIVNYTNVCVAKCDYCSFYRLPHQAGTYLLTFRDICQRLDELLNLGGTLVGFNGGFHPKLKIHDYATLFKQLRQRYENKLEFFEMTVAEFMFSCKVSKVTYAQGADILRNAGTRWVTGGGAEVLDDDFRLRHSPGKYRVEDYFAAQRAILEAGMGSTATMVIGFDESLDERLNHLERLREFQNEMLERGKPLTSFLCWTYKPWNNELGGVEIGTREYLRWLAASRIYLDNFVHIRTSVLTKNEEALRGLSFGANDFDIPTEDEVTQKAGATVDQDFNKLLAACRREGFEPVHRAPFQVSTTEPQSSSSASGKRNMMGKWSEYAT